MSGSDDVEGGSPDSEGLAAMKATWPRLDLWREAIAAGISPLTGSDLHQDDQAWRWSPPTSLCVANLGSAREHLHAIRLLVGTRQLFPSATSTLARSALMSASTAVWMLAPDDPTARRRRMLTFASEDYRNHIRFGEQVLDTHDQEDRHPLAGEQIERLRERLAQVNELLATMGGKADFTLTTAVIPSAMLASIPDDRQRAQFEGRWRIMSGAAHGFIWPHFGAPGTSQRSDDGSGVSETTIGGSIETLVTDYFTAFHVLATAWQLFGRRSGVDVERK